MNGNETEGKKLAEYRVYKRGGMEYGSMPMNEGQISERRMYLRRALHNYPQWGNLSNSELEDIRLYEAGGRLMAEDAKGYDYLLPSGRVTGRESDFRRVRAMMPFEFMGLTGKDFRWGKYKADITECKGMVNKFIVNYPQFKEKGMGLYIHSGTKGSGKTMLACCLLNEISQRYAGSVKFVNTLDFLEITKKGFNGNDADLKAIHEAGLLVLDDIGVQMSREWVETVLYRLVNHRYAGRLPTIYTSNLAAGSLKIDERITDRIDSTTYPVALPEESIRRDVRRQEKQKLLEEIESAPQGVAAPRRAEHDRSHT